MTLILITCGQNNEITQPVFPLTFRKFLKSLTHTLPHWSSHLSLTHSTFPRFSFCLRVFTSFTFNLPRRSLLASSLSAISAVVFPFPAPVRIRQTTGTFGRQLRSVLLHTAISIFIPHCRN
ncbi:hypothetical protein L6164_008120 [Bauhinia variegata]|uniref:Uncharacterized protein n=1 Tax=Bauhinia variegata TaxID=167791 RepID=A0ACB9PFP2_BAUVA|nr:hypothetical protein L6164_008120 [Bauhinia variegata]